MLLRIKRLPNKFYANRVPIHQRQLIQISMQILHCLIVKYQILSFVNW
jgi:hypothetical protein